MTWHLFRHTFASRLTRTEIDIVTVNGLLGPSNISVTLRYAHSNADAKRRAVERIGCDGDKCDGDKIVTVVPRTTKTAAVL